ncbi:hypothetical protein [Roseibium marinum]|uniref:Uncharacterized protein n=1 Tax=Roseibium marinum TaxID=281252 RepID=A0A2S3V4S0_9HYPH|nr:hypothetical protein [Roseibium marinum]POF34870.1 hypothetical protein CLV41_1011330 [Roseibium marinum]
MSEKTAQPTAKAQDGAKLINYYKPVGIAALTAAALCCKSPAVKKGK